MARARTTRRSLRCLLGLGLAALCPTDAWARTHAPQVDAAPALPGPEPQFPLNVAWTLITLNDRPAGRDPPSFEIDNTYRASGFSGCNTYSMTLYPARHQRLLPGSIALTRKTCDKDVMALERQVLGGLHAAPTWALVNDELLIRAPGASMRFRRGI